MRFANYTLEDVQAGVAVGVTRVQITVPGVGPMDVVYDALGRGDVVLYTASAQAVAARPVSGRESLLQAIDRLVGDWRASR